MLQYRLGGSWSRWGFTVGDLVTRPDLLTSFQAPPSGRFSLARRGVWLFFEGVGLGPVVLLRAGGGGDGRMWALAGYGTALDGYRRLVFDYRDGPLLDCLRRA